MFKPFRLIFLALLLCFAMPSPAQDEAHSTPETPAAASAEPSAAGGHEGGEVAEEKPFDAHQGTWLNPIARRLMGLPAIKHVGINDVGDPHVTPKVSIQYDFLFLALLIMVMLAVLGTLAGKQAKLRPEGKPTSIANAVEAAAEGYHNYLLGIMGRDLAVKYTPLIASYFFAILFMNYAGLIPGLMSPTANPNVPIGLALVAFFAIHYIAIREAGIKSWFMHFVGEPLWLAPLNLPLHLIGEFVKPISLSLRLLGNVFGEETVIIKLAGLGIGLLAVTGLPFGVPLNLLMMCLGVLFGALQALVFSTLLAIYISILSTHHDDHDEHNAHGHVEHVRLHGHEEIVGHPSEATIAMVAHPSEATMA